jgi:hypothetical protein
MLTDLHPDILCYIARWLDIDDVFRLAAACRHTSQIVDLLYKGRPRLGGVATVLSGAEGKYYCSTGHPETKHLVVYNPMDCEMITAHSMDSILVKKYNGTAVLNFCARSRCIRVVDAVFNQPAVFTATSRLTFDRVDFLRAEPSIFVDGEAVFSRCKVSRSLRINKITNKPGAPADIRVVFEECDLGDLKVQCPHFVDVHYALRGCTWRGTLDLTQMSSLEIDGAPAASERGIACSYNMRRPAL